MSESASLTVDVPAEVLASLKSLAERTGRAVAELAGEALAEYVSLQQWQIAEITRSLAEIDAGAPMVSNAEVMAWLESWETPNELPPPVGRPRPAQ